MFVPLVPLLGLLKEAGFLLHNVLKEITPPSTSETLKYLKKKKIESRLMVKVTTVIFVNQVFSQA